MAKRGKKVADKWYPSEGDDNGLPFFSRVEIRFTDSAKTVVGFNISDLPEDIRSQATCHGLVQKLGDSYASVDGDIAKAIDNVQAVLDELLLGNWSAEREAGPRLKDLYEAVRRVITATGKPTPTDEQLDAKYKTHVEAKKNRENAKATPQIQAQLAIIEKEKADARVAEKVAAAAAATSLDVGALI